MRRRHRSGIRLSGLGLFLVSLSLSGCAAWELVRYWTFPDTPRFRDGDIETLPGLRAEVAVTQRSDGLWKIRAHDETDAMRVQGYLVARDRMFQLDLFRHMARGELASLLGDRPLGEKTTLQSDILNQALGFGSAAERLLEATSAQERAILDAYVAGINAWIGEEHRSLEHRLLGAAVRAWTPADSISIYLLLMHNLSGNADREMRRLRLACEIGIDGMQQVFPTQVVFAGFALPPEDLPSDPSEVAPAIAPELAQELKELCEQGRQATAAGEAASQHAAIPATGVAAQVDVTALDLLSGLHSLSASNNWVVGSSLSRSRKPILSSDPHLPHMNPPILWGIEIETPDNHVAGFAIPGLHRVVFGHNGHVAWGATTNHVDRQDLVVHRRRVETNAGSTVEGYDTEDGFVPFEIRTLRLRIKDREAAEVRVRYTQDGPLLNDIEPALARRIPLTALRMASVGDARDLDGAAAINHARDVQGFIAGILRFDQGCSNWVFADDQGGIGYRSPCRLPIRRAWRGTFPVPGWLRRYQWDGYVPKDRLPASTNPKRDWIATANSDIVPPDRFFTTYNNDSSPPWRVSQIIARLHEETEKGLTAERSAAIQTDLRYPFWKHLRDRAAQSFCSHSDRFQGDEATLQRGLCEWDGEARPDSREAALFNLWSNAVLDHALADALPGGAADPTWHYVQTLLQFESMAQWIWTREEDDPIWNDVNTPDTETRTDILERAFRSAVAEGKRRWGETWRDWQWGKGRPFVLRHAFANQDGALGRLFNSPPIAIGGDNESVFKNQYLRSDREHLNPTVGPVGRFTIDMSDPWKAKYTLAGGDSGWPASPRYANLLQDWASGKGRDLTPMDSPQDIHIRFRP